MAPAVSGGVVAYEDLFEVIDRDADGKKFDKVSRFRCRSQFEAELQIDVNVDIYNLEVRTSHAPPWHERFSLSHVHDDERGGMHASPGLDVCTLFADGRPPLRAPHLGSGFFFLARAELWLSQPLRRRLTGRTFPWPQVGTRFTLALAPTLSLDGTPEDGSYDQVRVRFPISISRSHAFPSFFTHPGLKTR